VPKDGHALVVANGVYGDRMAQMLAAQGKRCEVVASDWVAPMDLAGVERRSPRDATHHARARGAPRDHHRAATTTSPRSARSASAEKPMLLDGVSSFGGEPIDFAGWNLEAVAATANKCLHGVPGISFVLVREVGLRGALLGATSVYLDLWRHWKEQPTGWSPFTQSVHVVYALQEALAELEDEGGWRARHATYARGAQRVREVLRSSGWSTSSPTGRRRARRS
jgi:2-aminoethylphosphonate-pyruvate transaminase